jgi:hypothetical protein
MNSGQFGYGLLTINELFQTKNGYNANGYRLNCLNLSLEWNFIPDFGTMKMVICC